MEIIAFARLSIMKSVIGEPSLVENNFGVNAG
jgi:hypothetical protein